MNDFLRLLVAAGLLALAVSARADGFRADLTDVLQRRIDAASRAGGGEAVVPAGEWRLAPVRLRSGVRLRLARGAHVYGTRDCEACVGAWTRDTVEPIALEDLRRRAGEDLTRRSQYALFTAFGAHDIEVVGEEDSFISGENCPDARGAEGYRGPHVFSFACSTNVVLRNVTVRDSGDYAYRFLSCHGVTADGVKARGGHDGVHFDLCSRVRISNADLRTGDDAVAGSGCSDVVVSNCLLNTACSPFRLGGRDVLVTDCRAWGPAEHPHRWTLTREEKLAGAPARDGHGRRTVGCFYQGYTGDVAHRGFVPGNIVVRNTTVENAERFLLSVSGLPAALWQDGRGITDITFENVRATGLGQPSAVVAKADEPLTITLKDCSFAFRTPQPCAVFGRNVKVVDRGVRLENAAQLFEERPDVSYDDVPEFPSWRVEPTEQRAKWGLPPLRAETRLSLWPEGKVPDFRPQQTSPYLVWTDPASNKTGACVILISGGAYKRLCDGWLVEEWRRRFLSMGVTCVELVHRTPRPEGLPIYQSAWEDGQRAVRIVRREAAKRGLARVGACGMSAGAHLATLLATSSQTPAYARVDDLDDTPCNLDFALCFAIAYGMTDATAGTLNTRDGDGPDLGLDPAFRFDAKTCPMWMGHGGADPNSPLVSTHVYRRLRQMKVPAEVHLYPDRPHGAYGLDRAVEFLRQMEFLGALEPPVDLMTRYPDDSARASCEKRALWPADATPDVRTNQCTPYLEWHVPKVLRTKAIQIIYSGGCYECNGPDGHEVAPARRFLNEKGMTVVTMRYRTPRPAGLPKHVTAWQDLQRCIRLVRSEALARGLDPDRIGIMGSSAGGHLTLMGATSSRRHAYLPNDTIDKAYACNANWAVAVYPAYALADDAERLVPELSFDLATCPTLFIHGDADEWTAMGSVLCWEQMRRMGIQGELHTLALRPHCFQFKAAPGTGSYTWLERIWEFLEAKRLLDDYDASDEAAAKRPEWEDPSVNAVNRLPPRTYSMPLASEADALTDDLEPATPYRKSLNGSWKISWTGNPQLRVKDFWKTDFDDSRWFAIDVPSCVEMKGFGSPAYSAGAYPHAAEFPRILDFDTKKPDYNPVSSYRTTFTVPESWKGRRVILRFDGVYSAYYVWVNGRKVGYAEDSKLPSEFDITDYIHLSTDSNIQTSQHSNILAVEVFRWSDGSYLEDQDMFRFSGIFRDVTLWSMPKDGVWDFRVKAPADGRLEVAVLDEVEKRGGQRTQVSIYDAGHTKVGNLTPLSTSTYFLHLSSPRLWSAEDPYLYTLVIRRGSDIRMKRIGFKEQKVVGNAVLVNGKAIKFKGVNRHETSVDNARTVSLAEMLRDAELMKRYNIDTVRTSHYPDHHLWYDICDRYGLYVMAEANVEGHAYGFGADGVGSKPAFYDTIVERNVRQVLFYRNHPSVTFWSMGNETGHGDGFRRAIAAVKEIDPSRPIHWQIGNADADVDSSMYPSVEWLEKRGALGDARTGTLGGAGSGAFVQASQHTAGKPYFCCEYAHAMGNAIGNFQEYWDVFYRYSALTGGCIWDWIDQSFWWPTDRLDPKTGRRGRFLAYGSDFDEVPGDGPFCNNGVIGPNRAVSAKLIEVAHVHRNLVVSQSSPPTPQQFKHSQFKHSNIIPTLTLENRFGFTRADAFEGKAELVVDGVVVETQAFAVPPVEPLSKGTLVLPAFTSAAKGERFVNVSFLTKADTPWAKRGWCVARDQIAMGDLRPPRDTGTAGGGLQAPRVSEADRTVSVTAGPTRAVFCRASGTLCELAMNGRTILKDADFGLVAGPRLTVERAYTDNDRWMRHGNAWVEDRVKGSVYSRGLTQLRYHARPLVVVATGGVVTVESEVEVTGSKSAGFTHLSRWTFRADGSVAVANTVDPHGTMPPALPRLGFTFRLDKALDAVAWYGRGPHENYVDRCTGSFIGLWRTTVDGLWEPYVRPQDNGCRGDVRWVELTAADGRGVRFAGETPMFFQAMRYSPKDLEFARHRGDERRSRHELVPRDEIWLNVDFRQTGLGGGSCGPLPLPKYVFPIRKETWQYTITPTFVRPQTSDL